MRDWRYILIHHKVERFFFSPSVLMFDLNKLSHLALNLCGTKYDRYVLYMNAVVWLGRVFIFMMKFMSSEKFR